MTKTTERLGLQAHDIWAAFSLLTRLPVPVDHARAGARGAASAWAFPIVGLVLGFGAGLIMSFAAWLNVPDGMAIGIALAFLAIATGGMHEDGLADFADAMGGATKERRLEIMKDSRVGAYGVIAITVALLLRWSGMLELSGWTAIFTLAAIGATSRASMVLLMSTMPSARKTGLAASVGKPNKTAILTANAIALLACLIAAGMSGVVLFALMLAGTIPVYWFAKRLLGGKTGDVLGAAQQCAEITGLAVAIALIA